jgi:hypothetical protein
MRLLARIGFRGEKWGNGCVHFPLKNGKVGASGAAFRQGLRFGGDAVIGPTMNSPS